MNQNKKKWIVAIGFFIIIAAFTVVMSKLISVNSECSANPLVYGAKKASNAGTPIECTCKVLKPNYADFWFNKERIEVIKDTPNFNISLDLGI